MNSPTLLHRAESASLRNNAQPKRLSLRSLMLAALFSLTLAVPSHAFAACTGNLKGAYGMSVQGASRSGMDKYLAGTVLFAPATCQVQGVMSSAENNKLGYFTPMSGTFATNADGTIALTLNIQGFGFEMYTVAYSSMGDEAVGIESDPSAIASIHIKAQGFPGGVYKTTMLNGIWAASCQGVSGTFSDLNYFTLSGGSQYTSGSLKGTDVSNRAGQAANNGYSGTYAVLNNGAFGGNLTVAGDPVTFLGVVDNNLNELRYFYNDSNVGTADGRGFDFCVARRVK